jgi:hypothetical protein
VNIAIDLNTVDGYRNFLRVKSLPVYRFVGREAWFPDEYADRMGLKIPKAKAKRYTPKDWLFDYQSDIASITRRHTRT